MCKSFAQCFGAPFIVAHMENGKKERFFGSDRLELLAFILGELYFQFQTIENHNPIFKKMQERSGKVLSPN